ncbi:MAG: hypothetical protein SVV03_01245 [Candidatus Nanohaloarchaea archaeon]|nr:hypothetical protein [Candidatus Nanohaloarchaea archaeon]
MKHLNDAETGLNHAKDETNNQRVASAMAVHAVIKALVLFFSIFLETGYKRNEKESRKDL